jgi:hypothetical protein
MAGKQKITLTEAAKLVHGATGRTVRYWASRGVEGVKLAASKGVDGKLYTTAEDLRKFFKAVGRDYTPPPAFDRDEEAVYAARRKVPGPTGELCVDQED